MRGFNKFMDNVYCLLIHEFIEAPLYFLVATEDWELEILSSGCPSRSQREPQSSVRQWEMVGHISRLRWEGKVS